MKQDEATLLLMERYGILKGARLIQYALMLNGFGPEHFDREASQQQRSKFIREMRDAGVYWDDIEFDAAFEGWWLKLAKKARAMRRRTA